MKTWTRVPLFIGLASLCIVAHAQAQSPQASMIHGTYLVRQTRTCLVARETAPGASSFSISTAANGYQQVTTSVTPMHQEITIVYVAVIDSAKGTIVADDMVVTGMNGDSGPGWVWGRSHRTSSSTFSVDRATDTLLMTGSTAQGIQPSGGTATWFTPGGGRLRTVDNGTTYENMGSDGPVITEQTVTEPNGTVHWNSIICDGPMRGELITRSIERSARR